MARKRKEKGNVQPFPGSFSRLHTFAQNLNATDMKHGYFIVTIDEHFEPTITHNYAQAPKNELIILFNIINAATAEIARGYTGEN